MNCAVAKHDACLKELEQLTTRLESKAVLTPSTEVRGELRAPMATLVDQLETLVGRLEGVVSGAVTTSRTCCHLALAKRQPPVNHIETLDPDLLSLIVTYADTRFHVIGGTRAPIAPLAITALGCVCSSLIAKLKLVRPAIRTGTFGQARSGALHRRLQPGPIQSVADAIAFEERGIWQIGQLSSLSYSAVDDLSGLSRCRVLHTLQLTQCRHLMDVAGLAECPSLEQLYLTNLSVLMTIEGLRGAKRLRTLELSGCKMVDDVAPLAGCPELEHLLLAGSHGIVDVSALGRCAKLQTLDMCGLRRVTDLLALRHCHRLWKLDIRGTGFLFDPAIAVPPLPSVKEMRGPGWHDLGLRGRVLS